MANGLKICSSTKFNFCICIDTSEKVWAVERKKRGMGKIRSWRIEKTKGDNPADDKNAS